MFVYALLITIGVSVISLNCKGFKRSTDYIKDILRNHKPTILYLQETWHLSNNVGMFSELFDFMYFETSGVPCDERILAGRPYVDLATIYNHHIAHRVTRIKSSCRSLCGISIQRDGALPMMLINVYMPCDANSRVETSGDFNETVLAIEILLAPHDRLSVVIGI